MRYHPISGATATTSNVIETQNLENISFQFNLANHTSGNGVLTVYGSNDGVNFTQIAFIDPTVTNTNAQTITRINSKTLSANGSTVGCLENWFKFEFIKFTVTVTTDGTYDVYVFADKKAV